MNLKFLKAGTGDSILVQHENYNIIIDGGDNSKYLLKEVDAIFENGNVINLLVITHHDDDHIKGIIDLLNHIDEYQFGKETKFIEQVVFNSPRKVLDIKISQDEKLLSYKQAFELEELIIKTGAKWERCTEDSKSINLGELKIDFLSPSLEDIEKYSKLKGAYLTGDHKCDWGSSMAILEKHIDDESQDKSIPNKSSVVLKLHTDERNVLLTGDVTPDRFETIINKLSSENGDVPVNFDIVKLPHHGSYRSITKNILEKIDCNTYIISTNSKKHYLPNKRSLLKVLNFSKRVNNQTINFVFNYDEALNNLKITNAEKKDYNFILTPSNENYGISI